MINHNTTEIFFDNLEVPRETLIGEESKGFRHILDGMNAERMPAARECIGDGRWLLQKGIDYAKEVGRLRPTGQGQWGSFRLAGAYAELEAADMVCLRAVRRRQGIRRRRQYGLSASEATRHAGEATFAAYGGFAFAKEYDIERKWREARFYPLPISASPVSASTCWGFRGLY